MTDPNTAEMEGELRTALRLLADDDGAAPGADIGRARSQGRRAIRSRRAIRVVAPVAVVAVAAAAVSMALPRKAEKVVPAQKRPPGWTVPVSFGWLPPGFLPTLQSRGKDGSYSTTLRASGQRREFINLHVHPQSPKEMYEPPTKTSPAEAVRGRPAYWVEPLKMMPPGRADLRFQYSERGWAELIFTRVGGSAAPDLTATVHKIAEHLDFTERPMALPFQITGLPAGLSPEGVNITWLHDPSRRKVRLSFTQGLRVVLGPAGSLTRPKPNTTVDGHPAYRFTGTETRLPALRPKKGSTYVNHPQIAERQAKMAGSEVLCVYGVQRTDLCLYTDAQVPSDPAVSLDVVRPGHMWASEMLRPSGGLIGLFRRMKLIDGPVSGWSADPLRQ